MRSPSRFYVRQIKKNLAPGGEQGFLSFRIPLNVGELKITRFQIPNFRFKSARRCSSMPMTGLKQRDLCGAVPMTSH